MLARQNHLLSGIYETANECRYAYSFGHFTFQNCFRLRGAEGLKNRRHRRFTT
jgi:hypothetical protein